MLHQMFEFNILLALQYHPYFYRIIMYIQWKRNKGRYITELFDELPSAFQAELSLETCRAMIEKVWSYNRPYRI